MSDAETREKLRRRIGDLEKVLRPFVKEADTWSDSVPDRYRPGVTEPGQKTFYGRATYNLGHLRRARDLFKPV